MKTSSSLLFFIFVILPSFVNEILILLFSPVRIGMPKPNYFLLFFIHIWTFLPLCFWEDSSPFFLGGVFYSSPFFSFFVGLLFISTHNLQFSTNTFWIFHIWFFFNIHIQNSMPSTILMIAINESNLNSGTVASHTYPHDHDVFLLATSYHLIETDRPSELNTNSLNKLYDPTKRNNIYLI